MNIDTYRGEFLPAALRRARVTEEEVRAAVRSTGLASLNEAEAVVLETARSALSAAGAGTAGQALMVSRDRGQATSPPIQTLILNRPGGEAFHGSRRLHPPGQVSLIIRPRGGIEKAASGG